MSTAVRTLDARLIAPLFSLEEAQSAADEWGLNCGPAAVAAVCRLALYDLRPHLGDFEQKGYTNPTLMWRILNSIGATWKRPSLNQMSSENQGMLAWPSYGLARVQWEGPWTAPGVPMRVRYRHTHWVGVDSTIEGEEINIFDVNCMCVGGWVPFSEWLGSVVPWLLRQCEPKANGRWHLTHVEHLAKLAEEKRAVMYANFGRPIPAVVMMNMQSVLVLRMIRSGVFEYKAKSHIG
jgi:hypothetical protein